MLIILPFTLQLFHSGTIALVLPIYSLPEYTKLEKGVRDMEQFFIGVGEGVGIKVITYLNGFYMKNGRGGGFFI